MTGPIKILVKQENLTLEGISQFYINLDMVGHKLGEFAPTRTFRGHVKSDKKSRR